MNSLFSAFDFLFAEILGQALRESFFPSVPRGRTTAGVKSQHDDGVVKKATDNASKKQQPKQEDMADNTQDMSYQAGEAKGQTKEKASGMMDKAGNVTQSAKESSQQAGQQVKDKAQGAAESVKNAVGMNK
ncbi:uncharacterized protein LOC132182083 [Corylus avellana]|uniref:uncharacterized protein LOC132182083 n=1 Tax=Corylus avellana TaxID=13451 RepID=UPI00286BADE0|nr:uncharacterized protein LOC132182083 [Corylus avellana]